MISDSRRIITDPEILILDLTDFKYLSGELKNEGCLYNAADFKGNIILRLGLCGVVAAVERFREERSTAERQVPLLHIASSSFSGMWNEIEDVVLKYVDVTTQNYKKYSIFSLCEKN